MRKTRLSRTSVYIIIISVFLLIVNISLGFVLTQQSSAAMRSLIESRMLDVSNTAAALLDGDTLEELQAEDRETPQYQSVLKMLTSFEENIELEYIYCVRDMGDGNFVFMIDPDPKAPGEFGEHIPYTDALHLASLGTPSVDKEPYEDSWGRFYSAYSPVFDTRGQVAGIVAVDFSAEWYDNQVSHQIKTTLLISGISLLFAGIIILMITTRNRKRFNALFQEMNKVSEGIETLVHEATPWAEIAPHEGNGVADSRDEIAVLGTKIQALQEKLGMQISMVRSLAYIDGMTKLGNRAAYEDHVRRLDDQIKNGAAEFAIVVFDLNGLKEINDSLGHEKGDETIVAAASALKSAFHKGQLYRIGGDEFIAIMEGANEGMQPWLDESFGENCPVSMSKGYAVFDADADTGYRMVFNRADSAMYADKKAYYLAHSETQRHY